MSFFEAPELQDIVLEKEFQNVCNDKISSKQWKNKIFLPLLYRPFEKYYARINTQIQVSEYSFKSHMHIPSNDPRFSYDSNDTGYFRFYDAGSDKAVIVVPPRGSVIGWNFARVAASYTAAHGFDAYEMVTPFHGKRMPEGITSVVHLPVNTEIMRLTSKQAVEEILGLVNLLREQKGKKEIGILGISQGAAYASIVSELAGIRSSVYVHGLGGLAELLLCSQDRFSKKFRSQELTNKDSIDEAALHEELRAIDPLTYVKRNNPDSIVMINARNDHSLPERNIHALHEALGKPEIHWFHMPFVNGHFYIAVRTKKVLKIALGHFERTLK